MLVQIKRKQEEKKGPVDKCETKSAFPLLLITPAVRPDTQWWNDTLLWMVKDLRHTRTLTLNFTHTMHTCTTRVKGEGDINTSHCAPLKSVHPPTQKSLQTVPVSAHSLFLKSGLICLNSKSAKSAPSNNYLPIHALYTATRIINFLAKRLKFFVNMIQKYK